MGGAGNLKYISKFVYKWIVQFTNSGRSIDTLVEQRTHITFCSPNFSSSIVVIAVIVVSSKLLEHI